AAAHLRSADADVRIFGEPMHFWRNCMPEGMLLRSPWRYSQISDPRGAFSLDRFAGIEELRPVEQLPIATFLRYADWFQRQAVPGVRVIARAGRVHWLGVSPGNGSGLLRRIVRPRLRRFVPPPHIGPFPLNWMLEHPAMFRLAPRKLRRAAALRALRPAGAGW